MSRIAVIAHSRTKAVSLFDVACRKPINKPGDYLFYEFLFVQDRLWPTLPASCQGWRYQRIRQQMSKLAPLVGKWNVASTFHRKDGVTEQVGTWSVSSVLDDTYLEFQTERHTKDTPNRSAKVF